MQLFGCSSQSPVQFTSRSHSQTRPAVPGAQPQFGALNPSRVGVALSAAALAVTAPLLAACSSDPPNGADRCNEQADDLAKGFSKVGLSNTTLRCDVDGWGGSYSGEFDNGTMNIPLAATGGEPSKGARKTAERCKKTGEDLGKALAEVGLDDKTVFRCDVDESGGSYNGEADQGTVDVPVEPVMHGEGKASGGGRKRVKACKDQANDFASALAKLGLNRDAIMRCDVEPGGNKSAVPYDSESNQGTLAFLLNPFRHAGQEPSKKALEKAKGCNDKGNDFAAALAKLGEGRKATFNCDLDGWGGSYLGEPDDSTLAFELDPSSGKEPSDKVRKTTENCISSSKENAQKLAKKGHQLDSIACDISVRSNDDYNAEANNGTLELGSNNN